MNAQCIFNLQLAYPFPANPRPLSSVSSLIQANNDLKIAWLLTLFFPSPTFSFWIIVICTKRCFHAKKCHCVINRQKVGFLIFVCAINEQVLFALKTRFTGEKVRPQALYPLTLFYPLKKCALIKLRLYVFSLHYTFKRKVNKNNNRVLQSH